MISDLCSFLDGHTEPIVDRLKSEMSEASDQMRYEKAAVIRDQLNAIDRVVEKQKVITDDRGDSDVLAMARSDGEACVQIFFIRNGKLLGREYFVLEGTEESSDSEVISEFMKQFYSEAALIPNKVLLPEEIEEAQIINQWLNTRRGGSKGGIARAKIGGTPGIGANGHRKRCRNHAVFACAVER